MPAPKKYSDELSSSICTLGATVSPARLTAV